MLLLVSEFIDRYSVVKESPPTYWYRGDDSESEKLPRTAEVEAIARGLMQQLARDEAYNREGKMYGVLLVELPNGEKRVLKAFSGLLQGESIVAGWVPPIPGREKVSIPESFTLRELETIKQNLIELAFIPARDEYVKLAQDLAAQLEKINLRHAQQKADRDRQRSQLADLGDIEALEALNEQSRLEGIEKRQFKRNRDRILHPLKEAIARADTQIQELKERRRLLSRQLQTEMHDAYSIMNFAGTSRSLKGLMPQGLPTGTGDCCAPKLLHYAAANKLKPLAMAEFWWGSSTSGKIAGEFYEACAERCQPIMEFLLSGLSQLDLPIIYQDEWLIAINKPSNLLSVPGRYLDTQDSVVSRLHQTFAEGTAIKAVHRLDLETSGILLLAKDANTYTHLSQQFQNRQVQKVYEAVLAGVLEKENGTINLPLSANLENRPQQQVNWQSGKPSVTKFQVLARKENHTRIQFMPVTGRTHQIRVHAADSRGLGMPILGDRLYGSHSLTHRLHLHARELSFQHPRSGKSIYLQAKTPF
jgi:tRNA pseudouridine32 synthase / 23S rRNA pseudouridine746 synthase